MDKTLLSMAQLAVFQTNTLRATVFLVDDSYQYLLADATLELSLAESNAYSSNSRHSRIPRGSASCRHCLLEAGEQHDDLPCDGLIVPDCSKDDRFKDHTLVTRDKGVRFYAAVPMLSNAGHQIGVLAVFDSSPREHLNQIELGNLRESAACAVRHLELIRTSMDCTRKSKLLRAIASSLDDQYPCLRTQEESQQDGDDRSAHDGSVADMHQNPYLPPTINRHTSAEHLSTTPDQLTCALNTTIEVLQQALLVDNVAVYGPVSFERLADADANNVSTSETHDAASTTKQIPTILLASSFHQDGFQADAQPAPSIGLLDTLLSKYPNGTALQVTSDVASQDPNSPECMGSSVVEEFDRNDVNLHDLTDEQILNSLRIHGMSSDAQNLIFLPVYHPQKRILLAAFFLWSTKGTPTLPLSANFTDLRAIGNCLSQHAAQILTKKTEAGLLSNISHELRSPIHGVMGAAQFLQDAASTSYQTGLIDSILICSNTLLDTLNLMLDHTKLERTAQQARFPDVVQPESPTTAPSVTSMFMSEPADLALLVEEATESVVAGHFFENRARFNEPPEVKDESENEKEHGPVGSHSVKVILSLAVHDHWSVETQPGAIRRIILNVLGNSLKFTPRGSIQIALDHDEQRPEDDASTLRFHIRVEDTGIGMSQRFQEDSLFTPFRQENRFEPGVGLGLSIVRRIVKSLGGKIVVESRPREGTSVDISLSLPIHKDPQAGIPQDLQRVVSEVKGKHLVFIDAQSYDEDPDESTARREDALREVAANWLGMRVSGTGKMDVKDADFYLYSELPPVQKLLERHRQTPDHQLSSGEIPLIVVATDSKEAHMVEIEHAKALEEAGRIVEVLSQPCGPRKLAKVLETCLNRQKQSMKDRMRSGEEESGTVPDSLADDPGTPSDANPPCSESDEKGQHQRSSVVSSSEGSRSLSRPLDHDNRLRSNQAETSKELPPRFSNSKPKHGDIGDSTQANDKDIASNPAEESTERQISAHYPEPVSSKHSVTKDTSTHDQKKHLHGLIVDDNRVNLRLLVTLMKKSNYTYSQAENGQEAFDAFKASADKSGSSPQQFDFVLMDIGMPVLNGIEATKRIRGYEREHSLQPTKIIALTAWADTKTQEEAIASGMDLFLPKPVKFAQLREILGKLHEVAE